MKSVLPTSITPIKAGAGKTGTTRTNGRYLWNDSDNTIFGKPVITSPYMPKVASGAKSIVFGDFSYYWLIERQPLSIKRLSALYALNGQIGFSAYERLDGKLVQPDALKILQIKK